jgi:hypothetical protein
MVWMRRMRWRCLLSGRFVPFRAGLPDIRIDFFLDIVGVTVACFDRAIMVVTDVHRTFLLSY